MIKTTIVTTNIHGIGRDNAIKRFLEYHSRFEVKIIVGSSFDGSFKHFIDGDRIRYIRTNDNDPVADKLKLILHSVETPYVSWVADDDFITRSMIEQSEKVLDDNIGVVASDGMSVFFTEKNVARTNVLYTYRQHKNLLRNNNSNTIEDRFRNSAMNFNPMVLHGVIRCEAMKKALNGLSGFPIKWNDNIMLANLLLEGAVFMLPTISNVRSHDTRLMIHSKKYMHGNDVEKKDIVFSKEVESYFSNKLNGNEELVSLVKKFLASTSVASLDNVYKRRLYTLFSRMQYFVYLSKDKRLRRDIQLVHDLMNKYPVEV